MKKLIATLLPICLSASLLAGCGGGSGQSSKSEQSGTTADTAAQSEASTEPSSAEGGFDGQVVLGATAPLTGPNQLTGEYYVNGMKMAVDEINAAGGILGKELVLDVQDEGTDQSIAINATIKLIESGVPAIIGSYFSTNCMAVLPEIEKIRFHILQTDQTRISPHLRTTMYGRFALLTILQDRSWRMCRLESWE